MGKVARTRRRIGKFKGWRIKVSLHDGRTITGKNHASDRHMNIILDEADETRVIKRKGEVETHTRNLGFVMIRGMSISHIDFAEKPVGKVDKKKAEPKAKVAPNLLGMMPKMPMPGMMRPGMPMPGMMPGMMGAKMPMPGMPPLPGMGMPGMGGMPKMPGMPMMGMPGMMPGKGMMPGMPGMMGKGTPGKGQGQW